MNYWQSYKLIVLMIPRIISLEEKRGLRSTALVKETLPIHRGRKGDINETTGIKDKHNGNKNSKNKGNIRRKTTGSIYINISLLK